MKSIRSIIGACVIAASPVVSAAPIAAIDPGPVSNVSAGQFTVGWAFTVNESIRITELGYYDFGQDGLDASHAVGFWTSSGTLLASGTVANLDPLDGEFRYTDIGDIVIGSGNYVVAGFNSANADEYVAVSSFTTPSEITWLEGRFLSGGSLQFPTSVDLTGTASVFGASFRFEAVPEPASLALIGIGLAGLGFSRRKRAAH